MKRPLSSPGCYFLAALVAHPRDTRLRPAPGPQIHFLPPCYTTTEHHLARRWSQRRGGGALRREPKRGSPAPAGSGSWESAGSARKRVSSSGEIGGLETRGVVGKS